MSPCAWPIGRTCRRTIAWSSSTSASTTSTSAARALADFDVVCVMRERMPVPRALFEKLPKLKLVVTTGKRNASIDMAAAADHKITVCGAAGGYGGGSGLSTAELAVGLMLAMARHLREEFHAMRPGGGWQTTVGFDLDGRTLGIIGLGNLGTKVGKVCAAIGMKVIAWSENLMPERAKANGAERVDKDELFRRSDVISIHTVLSPRTKGLVGARELALMKPTAILVNTSRGPIVDEPAMLAALREKRIAGYGADNYDTEPAPPDHPCAPSRAPSSPRIWATSRKTPTAASTAPPSPASKPGSPASRWG
jgi:D-3-phosphoglycerate dehydrogenase